MASSTCFTLPLSVIILRTRELGIMFKRINQHFIYQSVQVPPIFFLYPAPIGGFSRSSSFSVQKSAILPGLGTQGLFHSEIYAFSQTQNLLISFIIHRHCRKHIPCYDLQRGGMLQNSIQYSNMKHKAIYLNL